MTEITDPATIDVQDPLPESNWIPRRWYAFVFTGLLLVLRFRAVELDAPTIGLDILIGVMIAAYMMGASAEQLLRGLTVLSALRKGVEFRKEKSVTATPETVEATASSSAAQPSPEDYELPAAERIP